MKAFLAVAAAAAVFATPALTASTYRAAGLVCQKATVMKTAPMPAQGNFVMSLYVDGHRVQASNVLGDLLEVWSGRGVLAQVQGVKQRGPAVLTAVSLNGRCHRVTLVGTAA